VFWSQSVVCLIVSCPSPSRMMEDSVCSAEVKEGEVLPPTIQKLMKGYNKYLRPFFENGPVTVGMSLDIASIDTISEINMDYTATIFLRQRWTDERLCFNGNKSLSLDGRLVELLWVPDTFIVDSKRSFLHDITVENRLIRIFPNGTVLYALRYSCWDHHTVACNMDLTKYPMDKQTCTLQLESWGYNVNDVMFHWTRGNESVSGLDTLQLAQYTLEDYYTSESEAVYETGKKGRSPTSSEGRTDIHTRCSGGASWVSFWISLSSVPARICIGVTTVLTMTTLMMGARTSLPNANCFIKAIDVYLGICFSFIFGALIEYAVAHFCTLHQPHSSRVPPPALESEEQKIYRSGGHTKKGRTAPPADIPRKTLDDCVRCVSLLKRTLRFLNCCHVENPHYIDNYSRMTFPLSFIMVNLLYWIYYLYF
uniref:Gamma-aminobutyric acid receptor subunit pi n=1 Tax=Scleropages formosus TaxID=113540 RepID=A0A8C9TT58_SCLFO